jgi:hypothetical protein
MNVRAPRRQRYPQIHIVDISPEHVHLWEPPKRPRSESRHPTGRLGRFMTAASATARSWGLIAATAEPDLIIANGL